LPAPHHPFMPLLSEVFNEIVKGKVAAVLEGAANAASSGALTEAALVGDRYGMRCTAPITCQKPVIKALEVTEYECLSMRGAEHGNTI
jgi:hypothetical protein